MRSPFLSTGPLLLQLARGPWHTSGSNRLCQWPGQPETCRRRTVRRRCAQWHTSHATGTVRLQELQTTVFTPLTHARTPDSLTPLFTSDSEREVSIRICRLPLAPPSPEHSVGPLHDPVSITSCRYPEFTGYPSTGTRIPVLENPGSITACTSIDTAYLLIFDHGSRPHHSSNLIAISKVSLFRYSSWYLTTYVNVRGFPLYSY